MVSAINFSLKYNLSAFPGSVEFCDMFREIPETDLKLDIIVHFKETIIRVVLKKIELNKHVYGFPSCSPNTYRNLCIKHDPSCNRSPWNESLVYNWRNNFQKGFRTAWLGAETSGRDEPRERCPTVKLLFMHFTLPEAAKECLLSVFHYTLWVAGTSEVDIRYLPINKSPVTP